LEKLADDLKNNPVLDDYAHMIYSLVSYTPDVLFPSPSFPFCFQILIQTLQLPSSDTIITTLDTIREIAAHDSLYLNPLTTNPIDPSSGGADPTWAPIIRQTVEHNGIPLVGSLLNGLTGSFHEDCEATTVTVLKLLAEIYPENFLLWVQSSITDAIPERIVNQTTKTDFMNKLQM
jgi:transportin-3